MKRKVAIISIVSAVVVLVGVFVAIIIHQEQAQKEAGLKAFYNGEGKPITEIADEFKDEYGNK